MKSAIYSNVELGTGVEIGNYCEIGHPSKADLQGDDFSEKKLSSFLLPKKTKIGQNSIIRSQTVIYSHVQIGSQFNTGHRVLIREHTKIGEKCAVGTNVVINGFCKIGDKTKIYTGAFLCQSLIIGKGVFIGPEVQFSDNKWMILGRGLKSVIVEDYVRIGIGAIILPGIRIGENAVIGAGTVVTKDVGKGDVVVGNPARILKSVPRKSVGEYKKSIDNWGLI